jgi:hypothetical protein
LNPHGDDGYYEDSGRLHMLAGRYEEACDALGEVAQGLIWVDLYLAVCEMALGSDNANQRLAKWHQRVAGNWHSGKSPSREDLLQWIRRHHPLPDKLARSFLKPVEAGLVRL